MKFKEYEMPDGRKAVFEYDENGVGKITLECMDMLMEFINDRKTEPQTDCEDVWRAGYKTGYDKGFRDAQKVKDSQELVKDLVKAFCEDGTWLERQGVYTLTLAEAKQRAIDIIESVSAKTEPSGDNLSPVEGEQTEELPPYLIRDWEGYLDEFEVEDEPQTDCAWK